LTMASSSDDMTDFIFYLLFAICYCPSTTNDSTK